MKSDVLPTNYEKEESWPTLPSLVASFYCVTFQDAPFEHFVEPKTVKPEQASPRALFELPGDIVSGITMLIFKILWIKYFLSNRISCYFINFNMLFSSGRNIIQKLSQFS